MVWRNSNIFRKRSWLKRWLAGTLLFVFLVAAAVTGVGLYFSANLKPVSPKAQTIEITIESGSTMREIAKKLKDQGLIRQAWAFERYVQLKRIQGYLQAGTYTLSPSQSTQSIVSQLTHGKVSMKLVVILPGQRIDQVRRSLIDQGFSEESVDAALQPGQYENLAALADKPAGASLEGYLFPESFEKGATTTPTDIVRQSILQMDRQLTAERRQKYADQGLTVYQAMILASIVEKEVITTEDRAQAAQVFLKRLREGMSLGSDVTAFYGSQLAGVGKSVSYDTPYNTRLHIGLPPTPISNISASSLDAVANPAGTDWLFFVSGDDGTTHFSRTYAEHTELVEKYCQRLCN